MKENAQTQFWMKIGPGYHKDNDTWDPITKTYEKNNSIIPLIKDFNKEIDKNAKILEVGCNCGRNLGTLYDNGFTNLYGCDIQAHALDIFKSRYPDVDTKVASALELPYEDESFDVVFTAGVLMHINSRDIDTALSEIYRCTKKGGHIWGFELTNPAYNAHEYRGRYDTMFSAPFPSMYAQKYNDLKLKNAAIGNTRFTDSSALLHASARPAGTYANFLFKKEEIDEEQS